MLYRAAARPAYPLAIGAAVERTRSRAGVAPLKSSAFAAHCYAIHAVLSINVYGVTLSS